MLRFYSKVRLMGFRLTAAKVLSATSTWVLKNIFRRPAANFPGQIALKVAPNAIADLAGKAKTGSVVVCGTNGKTTVTNLLADTLEVSGFRTICNRTGANLASGIAAALLQNKEGDWGVFECDEMWLAKALPQLKSDYLILLNLFRDQLDRVGEISIVQDSIISALENSPQTVLVYNADDPLCSAIAQRTENKNIAFGLAEPIGFKENTVSDTQMCQMCSGMLEYTYHQYGQLGEYRCPSCGFRRASLDYAGKDITSDIDGLRFSINNDLIIEAHSSGAYMVYNLLAAYTGADITGCSDEAFLTALTDFDPQNGRLQYFEIAGHSVLLNLAKNPTGFNQNLSIILQETGPKAVAFFVNDNEGDGRDVSWLWDIDFEDMADRGNLVAFAGGIRKNDVQVRLKYAGISSRLVSGVGEVIDAVKNLLPDTKVFVIANYTALPSVRQTLTEIAAQPGKGTQ